jgi:hypothetical protein
MGLGFRAPCDLRRRLAAANKGFMALFLRTPSANIALSPLAVHSYLRVCAMRRMMFFGTELWPWRSGRIKTAEHEYVCRVDQKIYREGKFGRARTRQWNAGHERPEMRTGYRQRVGQGR